VQANSHYSPFHTMHNLSPEEAARLKSYIPEVQAKPPETTIQMKHLYGKPV